MRKSLLAAAMSLAVLPAHAANLNPPVLSKNPVTGYVAGGCGVFFGVNTMGSAGQVNGGTPGQAYNTGAIGGTVGWGCPIGTTAGNFWFVEGNFDWQNVNGNTQGLALTGPASFEQKIALGSPLSSVLGLLPSNPFGGLSVPSLPLCPTNTTCGNAYPFIFGSVHEDDISAQIGVPSGHEWLLSPGVGLGLEQRWSDGVVADVSAQWKMQSTALAIGPKQVSLGNAAVVELEFKY